MTFLSVRVDSDFRNFPPSFLSFLVTFVFKHGTWLVSDILHAVLQLTRSLLPTLSFPFNMTEHHMAL